MYSIALQLKFRAQHFLIGGDWGAENQLHSHDYVAVWEIEGPTLNEHGYLLDLVTVESLLKEEVGRVEGSVLNDLEPFQGLNPSVERLARLLSDRLRHRRSEWDPERRLVRTTLRVWENEAASAAWTTGLP